MPYVPQTNRRVHDGRPPAQRVGELVYVIMEDCLAYIDQVAPTRFSRLAETIGALECAKLELYRRVVTPYEELAIRENGDLPELTAYDQHITERRRAALARPRKEATSLEDCNP